MEKERQKMLDNLWVRVILLGLSVLFFLTLCYFLWGTLISLFLAFTVAYIFHPAVRFLERRRWPFPRRQIPRGVGIAVLISTVFLVTAGFFAYSIPKTSRGIYQLGSSIKEQYPKYQTTVETLIKKYGNVEFVQSVEALIEERIGNAVNPDGKDGKPSGGEDAGKRATPLPRQIEKENTPRPHKIRFVDAAGGVKKYIPQVIGFFLHIIKNVFYSTVGFLGIVMNFVIFSVVSVYLLKDFDIIVEKAKTLFPVSKQERAMRFLLKINDNLRYFLRGQLIICLILSLIYSIGLTLAGIPLSFLIGFIGGFGNLIPYVGTGTGIILASALAFFQFHDFSHIFYVLITFGVGQMLEGIVITPRIMGKGLGLSPVMVILSILICSQLLGFLGLLLAVPIASTVKVFIDEFLLKYKSSQYYKE